MHQLGRAFGGLHLEAMHAVEEGTGGIGAIGILIGERAGLALGVPALAGDDAGMTAHAGVEVDHQTELFLREGGKCRHVPMSR